MLFSFRRKLNSRFRRIILVGFDIVCFVLSDLVYYILARASSSDGSFDHREFFAASVVLFLSVILFRFITHTYSNVWRYASAGAYLQMLLSDVGASLVSMAVTYFAVGRLVFWHCSIVPMLYMLLTLASRFTYSIMHKRNNGDIGVGKKIDVAIVGAGQVGASLAEELLYGKNSHYNPICFIDNDKTKCGNKIFGIKIIYADANIVETIKQMPVKEIFVAMSADGDKMEAIYNKYLETGCKVKIFDSPINGGSSVNASSQKSVREFQIEDLLFRKQIQVNNAEAENAYRDHVVLVTGGGGSIGSELCRQIAKCKPKKLVIVDIYENNAYDIQQELIREYGNTLDLSVEIASVRDARRLERIFEKYRPETVFHAAAHKHVTLMENSPSEAIKNNVMGTYNTANMAEKYGVKKFILVSTDKAVNPTNVMGASKRMCEMVIQCRTDSRTTFAAVRFGNVLGSNGSVIPLFKRQIANGGPITITDKRIIRYFMTILEASKLVMEAGAMAKNGELFVLDMGKPVKIYDLACNMIRLSGYTPEVDIKIEEIGLRPGEKLFEELLMKSEALTKTDNGMIFIEKDTPYSRKEVEDKLTVLLSAVDDFDTVGDRDAIKNALKKTVPTYADPETVNAKADQSEEMQLCLK